MGSGVKNKPLVFTFWLGASDSNLVLLATNVVAEEQGSRTSHSGLDLEFLSVSDWVLWEVSSSSISVPSLVGSSMAVPEDSLLVLNISSIPDIKALGSVLEQFNVLNVSFLEDNLLVRLLNTVVGPLSDDCSVSDDGLLSSLVGKCEVSSEGGSDGLGS